MNHLSGEARCLPQTFPPVSCPLVQEAGRGLQGRPPHLETLGLEVPPQAAIFTEVTEIASRYLEAPIALLSVVKPEGETLVAAVGLWQLGLMTPLGQTRRLSLADSIAVHVVDSNQPLVVPDIAEQPALGATLLARQYGLRAYAGVPLCSAEGTCIGALAVLDPQPRSFSRQDIAFLELLARWGLSEYERRHPQPAPQPRAPLPLEVLRWRLMDHLIQDVRSPLTSLGGMANMLQREIYGPLTPKQREYAEIIWTGSQNMMTAVDGIAELVALETQPPHLSAVDVELLAQQVVHTLRPLAAERHQRLSVESQLSPKRWRIDRPRTRQMLHYLLFSLLHLAAARSLVRLQLANAPGQLQMVIHVSNPWLGETLPPALCSLLVAADGDSSGPDHSSEYSQAQCAFLLSRHLVQSQGGELSIQQQVAGYRLGLRLPESALSRDALTQISVGS